MVTGLHSIPAGAPATAAALVEPRTPSGWPALASGVLDLLHEAVLVLARDARPLGMNRAARALLREGDGLVLSARGVAASTPVAAAALRRAVERAAVGETTRMQLPRVGRTPLSLRVEPHPQGPCGDAAAVVFVNDGDSRTLRTHVLTARYALTPTEASVTRRLATGAGLEQIARELDISLNTVRGHLKQIFAKTGTHRQVELVCKLLAEL
jgi:DNA-binding CsgD family transcriptional regulator